MQHDASVRKDTSQNGIDPTVAPQARQSPQGMSNGEFAICGREHGVFSAENKPLILFSIEAAFVHSSAESPVTFVLSESIVFSLEKTYKNGISDNLW